VESFTIIVPALNEAAHLQECLDSVARELGDDIPVLISDNASTDGTLDVANAFAADRGNVQVVTWPTTLTISAHWTAALDLVTTDYAMFLAADDSLASGSGDAIRSILSSSLGPGQAVRSSLYRDVYGDLNRVYPIPALVEKLGSASDHTIEVLLDHINHDELMIGIWKVSSMRAANQETREPTLERSAFWWLVGIIAHPDAGDEVASVRVSDAVIVEKRVHERQRSASDSRSGRPALWHVRASWNSVRTSVELARHGALTRRDRRELLLRSRRHSETGVIFMGPIWEVTLLPGLARSIRARARGLR
jgi:hypothetical protein